MPDKAREDVEKVLIEEILEDARRRAERIVQRAEREGEKLLEQVSKEAEAVRTQVLKESEKRTCRLQQVSGSALCLEERMRRLKVQGELIEEVFAEALRRLQARTGFDYRRAVSRLAVEAVLAMTGDEVVLRLAASDVDAIGKDLPAEVGSGVRKKSGREVRVTVAAFPMDRDDGGVVAESADGRQRFDNSFTGRLLRMKDELRFEIADRIFGSVASEEGQAKLENRNSKLK